MQEATTATFLKIDIFFGQIMERSLLSSYYVADYVLKGLSSED
jgi:hypothetical protein